MAESIFNRISQKCRAESAGVKRAEKIDEVVVSLLEEKGYSVSKKKPVTITEINLNKFDYFVTVCGMAGCILIPTEKTVERWEIEDPAGKDREVYEAVFIEIEKRVNDLVRRLDC
jgi:protein-tyrosine-phosphatase